MYISELQLKVNCRLKVSCSIRFRLVFQLLAEPDQNFYPTIHFRSIQFTFSCNSLVHDPALRATNYRGKMKSPEHAYTTTTVVVLLQLFRQVLMRVIVGVEVIETFLAPQGSIF